MAESAMLSNVKLFKLFSLDKGIFHYFCIANSGPGGGIGRRAGLKIQ